MDDELGIHDGRSVHEAWTDCGERGHETPRFVRACGFDVIGVDIAESMLRQARTIDPDGDYRLTAEGDFSPVAGLAFDLILSAFTFDNVPTMEKKAAMFRFSFASSRVR